MHDGFLGGCFGLGQWQPVEVFIKDGFHTLVTGGIEVQGPAAGGLEALIGVGFAQTHNAQARAEALLGMCP